MIKIIWSYIKVNFHCLLKTSKVLKEDHRVFVICKAFGPREVACTCGYNKGETFDLAMDQMKLFDEKIAK